MKVFLVFFLFSNLIFAELTPWEREKIIALLESRVGKERVAEIVRDRNSFDKIRLGTLKAKLALCDYIIGPSATNDRINRSISAFSTNPPAFERLFTADLQGVVPPELLGKRTPATLDLRKVLEVRLLSGESSPQDIERIFKMYIPGIEKYKFETRREASMEESLCSKVRKKITASEAVRRALKLEMKKLGR